MHCANGSRRISCRNLYRKALALVLERTYAKDPAIVTASERMSS